MIERPQPHGRPSWWLWGAVVNLGGSLTIYLATGIWAPLASFGVLGTVCLVVGLVMLSRAQRPSR